MGSCHKIIISVLLLLCSFTVLGQKGVDSLLSKSYDELFNDLNEVDGLTLKDRYARAVIKKAKNEDNRDLLIGGYHAQAILHNDETMLFYCDSIIDLTKDNPNKMLPAEAYQLKGDYYYNNKNYNKALDNYIQVSIIANKTRNEKYVLKSKYNIGDLKRKINEKKEAISLFKEYISYSNQNIQSLDTLTYLNVLSEIAHIYNDFNIPDSSSYYNKIGIKESKKFNELSFIKHFSMNEGVAHFLRNDYKKAIHSFKYNIPYFEENDISTNLPFAYYYCGKSYSRLNDFENAAIYYRKVDSIFHIDNAVFSISKDNYNELINYYKAKKDLKNQLLYINTLIKVDSLLDNEELYLNKTIYQEYDIPRLKSEKEFIIKEMEANDSFFKRIIIGSSILLLLITIILVYQFYKKNIYKKKFKEIMNSTEINVEVDTQGKTDEKETKTKSHKKVFSLDISPEIIADILKKIQVFENNQGYLSKSITLNSLSQELETNTNYLSKIINYHKNLSFANYLNSLRIECFIQSIKNKPKLRKYTIKALASEFGFSNSESFSKAFIKFKGIKPSYFLREFEKLEPKN